MRFLIPLIALSCLLTFAAPRASLAGPGNNCDITTPVNESEKESFIDKIKPCMDTGVASDPPTGWIPQGGKLRGSFGSGYSGKVIINTDKASMGCPATTYRNIIQSCVNAAYQYPQCTAKPGGVSASGGGNNCATGQGAKTRIIFQIPKINFPGFGIKFPPCLDKFMQSVQQWPQGGFVGMFASNVTVTGSVNPSMTGGCASGSVSFCGFGTGGALCTDDLGEGDQQIQTTQGADIILGANNYQGTLNLPSGGPCKDDASKQCVLLILPESVASSYGLGSNIIEMPVGTSINMTGTTLTITNPDILPTPITLEIVDPDTAIVRTPGNAGIDQGWVQTQ